MKFKTRIFISFFIIILLPLLMIFIFYLGFHHLLALRMEAAYGFSLSDMPPEAKQLLIDLFTMLVVILAITASVLSIWIYKGISEPVNKLVDATKKIRDGDMNFSIEEEGPDEIRELDRAFEEMRKQLKAACEANDNYDRESRELISNISHDLKTPVAAVKGYAEGLMDGVADTPEKMDRYIRTIYNKANEIDRLINELAFYSKIDTNRVPYSFKRIKVRDFFDMASEDLSLELEGENVEFAYENHVSENTEFIADTEQIQRVINNIVSNSIKYMDKPEKKIKLTVEETDEAIRTALTDNGRGIAQKDIGKIFDRFYRTDASRNSAKGGSGIGLSIVKKIVEDHGGRVWAASKEGEFTTIFFEIRKYMESENDE